MENDLVDNFSRKPYCCLKTKSGKVEFFKDFIENWQENNWLSDYN